VPTASRPARFLPMHHEPGTKKYREIGTANTSPARTYAAQSSESNSRHRRVPALVRIRSSASPNTWGKPPPPLSGKGHTLERVFQGPLVHDDRPRNSRFQSGAGERGRLLHWLIPACRRPRDKFFGTHISCWLLRVLSSSRFLHRGVHFWGYNPLI
jgi:hypothetical protein